MKTCQFESVGSYEKSIEVSSHVDGGGMLHLRLPVEYADQDVDLIIVIQSRSTSRQIPEQHAAKAKADDWPPGFFEETYGCLAHDPIERGEQGEYEIREEIK